MTLEHLDALIAFSVVMLAVSLLITILAQLGATVLGLRGTNLRWGLTRLIETVHPEFARHAGEIADKILRHPLISDSVFSRWEAKIPVIRRWQLASTIRVQELIGIMEKLSAGTTPLPPDTPPPATVTIEQAMATIAQRARASAGPELQAISTQVRELATALGMPLSLGTAVGGAAVPPAGALSSTAAAPLVRIEELIKNVPIAAETTLRDLKSWFESAMDRTAQRFTLHMRAWAIVFGILVAFALHLDAFRLLSDLSSNAELRASLVATSDALMRQAAEPAASRAQPPAGEPRVPEVYGVAMQQIGISGAPAFASREEAIDWLRKSRPGEAGKLETEYQQKLDGLIRGDADRLVDRANSVRALLARSRFQLVPDPYPGWDFWPGWPPANLHFWGILFSAGLLSLGAPFWYNVLRNLSNLRPLLATKQEKEQSQPAA